MRNLIALIGSGGAIYKDQSIFPILGYFIFIGLLKDCMVDKIQIKNLNLSVFKRS